MRHFDIIILGSGFGGSIMAMVLKSIGYTVLLVERQQHPRFAIGESSTPFANLLLEKIAVEFNLPRLLPLSSYGTWRNTYPEIACGLKRGFTFFYHQAGREFQEPKNNQLLVAASPNDQVADTHWYRPELDAFLVQEAVRLGVVYEDCTQTSEIEIGTSRVLLKTQREAQCQQVEGSFLLDATGPRGVLARHLGLPEMPPKNMPSETIALYNHFQNVPGWGTASGVDFPNAPYAVDDSAVHHLFEGGWIWVLRFNNGITSAGVSATLTASKKWGLDQPAGWSALLNSFPSVQKQFDGSIPILPWKCSPRIFYRCGQVAGDRWALLPSAAGFVDPLLSTGFALNLFGVLRLGRIFRQRASADLASGDLAGYAAETTLDLVTTEQLIGALYRNLGDFIFFKRLVMLYFAAMSFGETAWRLGREPLAGKFLLRNDHRFFPLLRFVSQQAAENLTLGEKSKLGEMLMSELQPFDIAGLCQERRNGYYPVNFDDLVTGCSKLQATPEDIQTFIQSLNLAPKSGSFLHFETTKTTVIYP